MAKYFDKSSKFIKFGPKLEKNRGTPLFSTKNKCVLNDSKWPVTHFGKFFFCVCVTNSQFYHPPP